MLGRVDHDLTNPSSIMAYLGIFSDGGLGGKVGELGVKHDPLLHQRLLRVCVAKRTTTKQHLVEDHARRPHVHLVTSGGIQTEDNINDLRRHQ